VARLVTPTASADRDPRPYRPCVGLVIFNPQGLVFVGRRSDMSGVAWQMPQGGIDRREKPRQAALRELGEETGIADAELFFETPDWLAYDLPPGLRDRLWRGRFRGQKQKWFGLRFTGDDRDIDLAASREPEFTDWRWVELAETPALAPPFKRDVYRRVAEIFAPFARPWR
jgi:putative (di)nucleoside polyphosphate hydrolase